MRQATAYGSFFLLGPGANGECDRHGGGIAFGLIAYVGIKLLAGRLRDISLAVAALFVIKFAAVRRWGWRAAMRLL